MRYVLLHSLLRLHRHARCPLYRQIGKSIKVDRGWIDLKGLRSRLEFEAEPERSAALAQGEAAVCEERQGRGR